MSRLDNKLVLTEKFRWTGSAYNALDYYLADNPSAEHSHKNVEADGSVGLGNKEGNGKNPPQNSGVAHHSYDVNYYIIGFGVKRGYLFKNIVVDSG